MVTRTASPGWLYNEPETVAKELYKFEQGSEVIVIEYNPAMTLPYYKVSIDGYVGWILSLNLVSVPGLKVLKETADRNLTEKYRIRIEQAAKEERQRAAKRKAAEEKSRAEMEARLKAAYDERTVRKIMAGEVWIGMTASMALESWGRPSDINRTTYASHTHEQWVYGSKRCLYFDNGILTAIQD